MPVIEASDLPLVRLEGLHSDCVEGGIICWCGCGSICSEPRGVSLDKLGWEEEGKGGEGLFY